MNKVCPNFNIPAVKARYNQLGPVAFYREYIQNGYQLPEIYNDISELPETRSVQDILLINKDIFDAYQQDSIIGSFVYYINTKRLQGMNNKEVHASLYNDFKQSENYFRNNPEDLDIELADNIKNVLDHYNEFYEAGIKRLNAIGIKTRGSLANENESDRGMEDQEYDEQGALFQKLNYSDESVFVQSSKNTASAKLKVTLSLIPKYVIENGQIATYEDGDYVEATNYINAPEYEDLDVIWKDLLYTLIDVPIGSKIDYLKNVSKNPKHQIIADHIIKSDNSEVRQLQNEFETVFSKQQAKWITTIATRVDKNGNRSVNVIDTNRYGAENIISADWYNGFLQSPIVKTNKSGEQYIDIELGSQLNESYKEALNKLRNERSGALKDISSILDSIGISLSPEALNDPRADEILKNNTKFIFERLSGKYDKGSETDLLDDLLENNNPFIDETTRIEELAKLENEVNPVVFEDSIISGDGKSKYSFVPNSYLSHQFRKFKDPVAGETYARQLLNTAYGSGSYYLKQLTGANRENFLHNFDLRYVDTLGNDANNQTNKPFGSMNTTEKEFYRVTSFQNGNKDAAYFIGLIPSDKTTLPIYKVPKIKVSNYAEANEFSPTVKRILLDQFTSEYQRVKQTIEQNNDSNIRKITDYHNGVGSKFLVFQFANKALFEAGELKVLTPELIESTVWPEIKSMMDSMITQQVDYWTRLGLNDSNIYDKTYKTVNGSNILNLAADYAVNNFIFFHNQTQLFSGDPALHGKVVERDGEIDATNSVNKTWINYFKRMAKDIAPGLDGNFGDKATFNTIFLKDIKYTSAHLMEYLEKVGGHLNSAYGFDDRGRPAINPADAQEYTTLEEHREVLRAYGRLDDETNAAIDTLINEDNITDLKVTNALAKVLQPVKPVYVGSKIENGINVFYYIKTSSFPLVPALTKGLEIDKLRVAMEDNGVDRAVYESGVKLGLQGTLSTVDKKDSLEFNELTISPNQIINLDRGGFRIQQELPYHGLTGNVNEGSQGRKLVLSNVDNTASYQFNGKQYTGSELKQIYENLHIEKMDRAWDNLLQEIGYNTETRKIENIDKLAKILQEEAEDRDYPVNDIYAIQVIKENGVNRFKVPLGFTNNSNRFESILNSLVTNRVIKSKLPGFTLVQGASSGFTKQPQFVSDENISQYEGAITWVDPKDTELNYIREENGALVSADILVPNYFNDINLKDYVVGGYLDLNRIPEELLTIIGLRIPTQGYNSMMKFRVKGFLPNWMGELAVVPAEITAQMGSDFDVDKLFLYRYNYRQANNGNLIKINTALPDNAGDISYDNLSSEQIDNLIIQMFEDRLSDVRYYDQILEPNGFGGLPDAVKNIRSAQSSGNTRHIFTSERQNDIYEVNSDGKMGTAIFSLYSTFYRTAQDVDLGLIMPLRFKNSNGEVVELQSLSEQTNIEGNKRSNTIMYLQSAAVDNSKEQLLGAANINEFTMNEAGVMAMLGLPEDFIAYFMAQPVMREYVYRVSRNGGILEGEFDPNIHQKTLFELLDQYSGNTRGMNTLELNRMINDFNVINYSSTDLLNSLTQQSTDSLLPSTLTSEEQELFSKVNDILQIKILLDFSRIHEIAGAIRALQSASNIDTKGVGTNLISVENKVNQFNQIKKAFKTKTYPLFNAESIFGYEQQGDEINKSINNTTAGRTQQILEDTRNMYSQILPYGSPVYTSVISEIYTMSGMGQNETNLRNIVSDLKSYILSSSEFIDSDVDYIRDSLLFGKENIASRWSEYSKSDKGKQNPLTKRIKANIAKKQDQPNTLNALNTPASNDALDINNSITYFFDMLNSDDSTERKLAEDLVKYHILTGAQYGPKSIGKYITYDVLEKYGFSEKLRRMDDNLYNSNVDFSGFYDQFFINNPFKAHSVNFELSGDKVEINRLGTGILTSEGNVATYIVKYDSNSKTPNLYKAIGTGTGDSIVYGKLPVNQQYKTVKNYNFERGPILNSDNIRPKEDNPVITRQVDEATPLDREQILIDDYNLLNESGVDEILNRIIAKNNSEYKINLANDLLGLNLDNVDVEISSEYQANGWYNSDNNTLYLNLATISQFANPEAKLEEVILHELLHAATVNLLDADSSVLSTRQNAARSKINRLFNEYSASVDQDMLNRYKQAYENYRNDNISKEDLQFLKDYKSTYYPLINIKEFVAAGLTSEQFRDTLKSNNLWTRFLDLISNLLGINTTDLDVLYTSTIELASDNQIDTSQPNISEDFSELNDKELAINEFNKQRDEFFRAYRVNNYWNNVGKKYTADSQKRFMGANSNGKYDRLKVWFWNNELRVSHIDPRTKISGVDFDITDLPESQEEKLIGKMIRTYEARLKILERRRRNLGDESDTKLDIEIQSTKDKLNKLKGERSIQNIYEVSSRKLQEIERGLNSDNINSQDLADYNAYLTELMIINEQVDFDTTEDGVGLRYNKRFNELAGEARRLKKLYNKKAVELLEKAGYYYLGMSPEQLGINNIITIGVKDIGTLESQMLDFSQSSSQHIQNVGYLIERAQFTANERYNTKFSQLEEVLRDYAARYGNDYTQLLQVDSEGKKTGFLINKYKDEYYKKSKGNKKFYRENSTATISEENARRFEDDRKIAAEHYKDNIAEYNVWLQAHDPNIWIKNFNNNGNYDSGSPARRYITIRPSDKWLDPKYTALKSKGEDDPAVRLFNHIEPIFRAANKKYNKQVNYIPEMRLDAKDLLIKGKFKGAVNSLWEDWTSFANEDMVDTRDENDKIKDIDIDSLTNEPRQYIYSRMFGDNLDIDEKSFDLGAIASAVIYQDELINVKHEIEPLLNIYYALLKDAKTITKVSGTEIAVDREAANLTEYSKYLISSWLYGQTRATNEAEEKFGKITDKLVAYIRLKGMGWNPFSAIGNLTQSFSAHAIYAAGSQQYFNTNDYMKSLGINLNQIAGSRKIGKKISKAFEYTDGLVLASELQFGKDKRLKSIDQYRGAGYLDPFFMTQRVEYFNQGQTMIAVLMNQKVKNLKGETKSVWDAFDDNFKWKTSEFGENPYDNPTEKFKLQSRIRKAIIDVHGNYARPIQGKKHFWVRAMMVFRTWLPQLIHNRFGAEIRDEFVGITTKGRYRSLGAFVKNTDDKFDFSALRQNLLWLLKLSGNTEMSELDQMNMRKNLGELLMLAAVTGMILLMKNIFDDDDENEVTRYVLNNLFRAKSDLTMFMFPSSWDTVIKDPIPLMSIVRDVGDWTEAGINTISGDGLYKTGYRKGQSKLFKETIDFIPGVMQPFKQWGFMQETFDKYNN